MDNRMDYQTIGTRRTATLKIVFIYVLFGMAWIYGSDTVLGWMVHDPDIMVRIAVMKGSLFILCTATLLYVLISRFARRLAEAEKLQIESLKDYQAVFNATNEAIFVHDARDGRILDVNESTLDIFGYALTEALALDIGRLSEGTPPYSQAEAVEKINKAMLEGPQVFEWLFRRKSGDVFWSEVSLKKYTTRGHDRVIAVVRDISESRRMQATLRESEASHKKLVNEQRIILTTSPAGICHIRNRKIVWANPAFDSIFGYDPETVKGMDTEEFFADHESFESTDRKIHVILESGVFSDEVLMKKMGGSPFWCSIAGQSVTPGKPDDGSIWIIQDISERKRAEEELDRHRRHLEVLVNERTAELQLARDAADAANKAKSMFLASMSHEIRTPMNALLGFAQLLERDPSLSPQARKKVATILKSGDHLLTIINDILEMSRIEAGRVEVCRESVNLPDLLEDLAVMFRLRTEEKGLAFYLEISPDLPRHIVTDLGKLSQVLINLLGNAVKFTHTGAITLRALVCGVGRMAVEVMDSGIGIAPEEKETLFLPFERTRSGMQTAGGTGLGLAISREYARLLDGEITVTSRVDEGSCFRFEFSAQTTETSPSKTEPLRRVKGLAPGQGEIRVLVVDDLDDNRELLRGMLEPLGFSVFEAASGEEAVEKVCLLKPRVILMDLVMPGMDGIEATRILRNQYPEGSPVIIGISASTFDEDRTRFFSAGVNAFIAKPFREKELLRLLSEHAGVLFVTEEYGSPDEQEKPPPPPPLDSMPAKWRDFFREALARNNITRIRRLAEEARALDPDLAAWMIERTAQYDMDGLKRLLH